jgi:hypothetical protein
MESPDSADRKWACVAVSNLIQNDPSTRRLLQGKNIVGALITRLSDSEEEVVVEAAGALRYVRINIHILARINSIHTLPVIYVLMVGTISVVRCTTRISLRRSRHSSQKYCIPSSY